MSEFDDLNPVKDWPKAKKLLEIEPHNLSGREKQQRYVLELHLQQMSCPVCHHKQNIYEAADGTKVVGDTYEGKYHCGGCGVELEHIVPFIAVVPWRWGRKNPPTKKQLEQLREMHKAG